MIEKNFGYYFLFYLLNLKSLISLHDEIVILRLVFKMISRWHFRELFGINYA